MTHATPRPALSRTSGLHRLSLPLFLLAAALPAAADPPPDPFALWPVFAGHAVFSCQDLTLSGTPVVDSQGLSGAPGQQGHVRSNGRLVLSGTVKIYGDAWSGPGQPIQQSGAITITGDSGSAAESLACTPRDLAALRQHLESANDNHLIPLTSSGRNPLGGLHGRTLTLTGNDTLTLPAGTYLLSGINLSGVVRIHLAGPVRILVYGTISMSGGAINPDGDPHLLRLWTSGPSLAMSGQASIRGHVYAPAAPAAISAGRITGGLWANRVTAAGNPRITRIVNDLGPTIQITAPLHGATVDACQVEVHGQASDASGAAAVTVTVNDQPVELAVGGTFVTTASLWTDPPGRILARATDAAGRTAEAVVQVTIAPPQLALLSPPPGAVLPARVVDLAGTAGTAVTITVNGAPAVVADGAWTLPGFDLGPDGPKVLTIAGAHCGGSFSTAATLHVDTTPPVVTVHTPAAGAWVGTAEVLVAGHLLDAHPAAVTVNGQPATLAGQEWQIVLTLAEGVHQLVVTGHDAAGHTATLTHPVQVDLTPPVLRVFESGVLVEDAIARGRPVVFTAQADDASPVALQATVGQDGYVLGSPFGTAGQYTLTVTATDKVGHLATAVIPFTIDLTPPAIDILAPPPDQPIAAHAVDLAGRVSADAVIVRVEGVAAQLAAPDGNWRAFTFPGLPLGEEGPNAVLVEAIDEVGNRAQLALAPVRDTQPPVLELAIDPDGLVTRHPALVLAGSVRDPHLAAATLNGSPLALDAGGAFSLPITLTEGENPFHLAAADTLGHQAELTRVITLDTQPPQLAVTANGAPLPEGFLSAEPLAVAIAVEDATPTTVSALLNGASFASGATVAAEGTYLLVVEAADAAGNTAVLERRFTIDLTPPVLGGFSPADGAITASSVHTLAGTCDDAVSVLVNGAPAAVTAGTFIFPGLVLTEGANTIHIQAADAAGNAAETSLTLILDTTPPAIAIAEPEEGTVVAAGAVTVAGTAQDPHLQSVTVEGIPATLAGDAFQVSVPLPQEGGRTLTATARDAAGNTASAAVAVVRDTAPPVITLHHPGPNAVLADPELTASGLAEDPHLAGVTVNGQPAALDGAAFSATVTLAPGAHTLTVVAWDAAGNQSQLQRTVTIDPDAPAVAIAAPAAGALLTTPLTAVSGTATAPGGVTRVTVNGRDAVLAGDAFHLDDLDLTEGENTLTARAWAPSGRTGVVTAVVRVDTTPPTVLAIVPGHGAAGVPPATQPRITFSEPVAAATLVGRIQLLAGGAPLPVELVPEAGGAAVRLVVAGGLLSAAEHTLTVAAGITDLAGHPLAEAVTAVFTTLDSEPPDPPLLDPVPGPLCLARIPLSGSAEPAARVEAAGGVQPTATVAGPDGAFQLDVTPAVPDGPVAIAVTAVDAAGNRSQPAHLTVELDCRPPRVMEAAWDRDALVTVRFSEAVDPATLLPGATVLLADAAAPVPFTLHPAGALLTLTLSAPVQAPLALDLTRGIADLAGNPLAEPYRRLFSGDDQPTLVVGEVFHDATSLPLAGVRVVLEEDGGPTGPDPLWVYTDARGRFQFPVAGSPVTVRAQGDGLATAWRRVVPRPGAATVLFDLRLAEVQATETVNAAGALTRPGVQLLIPGDALPAEGLPVAFDRLSEQSLPNLLPLGWTPAVAVVLHLPEGDLAAPADLLFTDPPAGAVIARYDRLLHHWVAVGDGPAVPVQTPGVWALVLPDSHPTEPGVAVPGAVLPAAAETDPGELQAELALDPPVILPDQRALGLLTVLAEHPTPSGLPVEALLDETLVLVDHRTLVQPPAATDLVLYRRDPSLAAGFGLGASEDARRLSLRHGVKHVRVRALPAGVRVENLVGPGGGTVTTPGGAALDIPEGALDRLVAVDLTDHPADLLPLDMPPGLLAHRAVHLAIREVDLVLPAALTFPDDHPGDQWLLLTPVVVDDVTRWRFVGPAAAAGGRLRCAPDVAPDLPAPWVVTGGLYVLARPEADPWSLFSGTVVDVDGLSPAAPALIDPVPGGVIQLGDGAGRFVAVAPAGPAELTALHLVWRNAGAREVHGAPGEHLAGQDIHLQLVPPRIVATSPADGAAHVSTAAPILVDVSEPLDAAFFDPADAVAVRVVVGTASPAPWPGQASLSAGGTRITWTPARPYPSAAFVQVTVSATLRDLQGYTLAGPNTFTFGVERLLLPGDVRPERIRLYAPGRLPGHPDRALVAGSPGALPGGHHFFVENLDRWMETTTVQAAQDGSFEFLLPPFEPDAQRGVLVGDTLHLHVLDDDDGDLAVVPLGPWLLAGGDGAVLGPFGGDFITDDDIRVEVPAGALPAGAVVQVTELVAHEVLPPGAVDPFFRPVAAVALTLSSPAAAPLRLTIPGAAPEGEGQEILVARAGPLGGQPRAMLVSTARWQEEPPAYRTGPSSAGEAGQGSAFPPAAASAATGAWVVTAAGLSGCDRANAVIASMTLMLYEPAGDLAYLAGRLNSGALRADNGFGYDPGVLSGAHTFTCPADFILPLRAGQPYELELVDPDTGFRTWKQGYDAPGAGWIDLPPTEIPGLGDPRLLLTGGTPFELFAYTAVGASQPLAAGIDATMGSCVIGPGALPAGRRVTLTNLARNSRVAGVTSAAGLTLSVQAQPGEPLLLAVEGVLASVDQPLTLHFNHRLNNLPGGAISLQRTAGGGLTPSLQVKNDGHHVTLTPNPAWTPGDSYHVTLANALFAALGKDQENVRVELPLRMPAMTHGGQFFDGIVADAAIEGDLLLLAARDQGLRAYDVSDPAAVRPIGHFASPAGPVAAVATDEFGLVGVLTGLPTQPITLRLVRREDLLHSDPAGQVAALGISSEPTVAAGFLRAEVSRSAVVFSLADPGPVQVDRDGQGRVTALRLPESLYRRHHPVVIEDALTGRRLWQGHGPAAVELVIPAGDLAEAPLPGQRLRLRAHRDTIWYAFTTAGRARAARTVYGAGGEVSLVAVADLSNAALRAWLNAQGSGVACRTLGPEDSVFFGRLALAPRPDARPVLLTATIYDGLVGFIPTGTTVALDPNVLQCLRSQHGTRLNDVAAGRWIWDDGSEDTLIAAIGHRRLELLTLARSGAPEYLAGIDIPWEPYRVTIALDPRAGYILLRDNAGALAVYSLSRKGSPPVHLYTVAIPAGLGPFVIHPELGLAFIGATPVQYRPPAVELVAGPDEDGLYSPVTYLQPLGAPEAPDRDGRTAPVLARVLVRLPGVPDTLDQVMVRVTGLGPGGGDLPDRPAPFLPSSTRIRLRRPAGLPLDDPGRHVFLSEHPLLLIADERARTGYWDLLSDAERDELRDVSHGPPLCRHCDRDGGIIPWGLSAVHDGLSGDPHQPHRPIELAAAGRLRFDLLAEGSPWLGKILDAGWAVDGHIASVPWAPSPPWGFHPGKDVRAPGAPEVELSTRTLRLDRLDLDLPAPGLDLSVERTYASGGVVFGDFGWGGQLAGLDLLRPNPDGTVDLIAAGGARYVFSVDGPGIPPDEKGRILTALGHPGELRRTASGGFELKFGDGAAVFYDPNGYPLRRRDRFRRSADSGSEITYRFGPDGALLQLGHLSGACGEQAAQLICPSNPRTITFQRGPAGVVTGIEDSAGRTVSYDYDGHGRLTAATHPEMILGLAAADPVSGRPGESYAWQDLPAFAGEDVRDALEFGGDLATVTDGEDRAILTAGYHDATRLIDRLCRGEVCHDLIFYPAIAKRRARTRDAQGRLQEFRWDDLARLTAFIEDPDGDMQAVTTFTYPDDVDEDLVKEIHLPTGGVITHTWAIEHSPIPRRAALNLLRTVRARDTLGEVTPSTPQTLVTQYTYLQGTTLLTEAHLPGEGRAWAIERDQDGDPEALRDPEGRRTELTLDKLGRVTVRKDPAGYETTTTYDPITGQVATITPPAGAVPTEAQGAGRVTSITYDAAGFPLQVTAPTSHSSRTPAVTHLTHNPLGWLLEQRTSPGGDRLRQTFDRGGRLTTELHGDGATRLTIQRQTTPAGLPDTITASAPGESSTTRFSYLSPSDGLPWRRVRSETGRAVSFAYDRRGRLVSRSIHAPDALLTTTVFYQRGDALPSAVTDPLGQQTILHYDPFDRSAGHTDPLLRRHLLDVDAAGRLRSQRLLDHAGQLAYRRDHSYNRADQPTRTETWRFVLPLGDDFELLTEEISYNLRGLPSRRTDPRGRVTTSTFDGAGREVERLLPDGTRVQFAAWPSGLPAEVVERPADPGDGPARYRTLTEYDGAGRPVARIAPGGHTTQLLYDPLGRLSHEILPDGRTTVIQTSPLGLHRTIEATGRTRITEQFDADGLLTLHQEQGGATFTAHYDSAGRLIAQHLPGGLTRAFTWRRDGALATLALNDGTTLIHTYDAGRRRIGTTVAPGSTPAGEWVSQLTYAYDPLDHLVAAGHDRGIAVTRVFDTTSALREDTLTVDGDTFTTAAHYDRAGFLRTLVYPDGTPVTRTSDPLNRLATLTVGSDTLLTADFAGLRPGPAQLGPLQLTPSHTPEGFPREVAAALGGEGRFALSRDYDPLGRAGAQTVTTTFATTQALHHDPAKRLTGLHSRPPLPTAGLWDHLPPSAAERLDRQLSPGDGLLASTLRNLGQQQLTTFDLDPDSHQVLAASGLTFDHDPLGHRSRSGATHLHHHFDGLLLAARAEGVDEPFLRFRYDPLGRRVAETAHGLTTLRLPFGDQVVQESLRSPSGTVTPRKRLYWGDGIDALVAYHFDPVGAGHLGALYFALTDPQGTVHALADAHGRVVESYLYRGDGTFTIFGGDTTPPALVLARLRDDHRLELAFSEPVQARENAFALTAQGAPLDVEVLADADLRVWTLTASLVPGMDLALALTGIADLAGHPLPDQELNAVVPAPGEGGILFAAPLARVLAVLDGPGQVAVVLGAAVDPDTVSGSLDLACDGTPIPGQVSLAEVGQERILLWSATGDYPGTSCTVTIGSGLRTAGGQSYAGPATVAFTPFQEGDVVWSDLHESPILAASQVGNDRFQHARPFIASLGLYDHRARFFDPATGTFLGPDPLGPVDSPNLYQAFGMDGVNVTDPWGLEKGATFTDMHPENQRLRERYFRGEAPKSPEERALEKGIAAGLIAPVAIACVHSWFGASVLKMALISGGAGMVGSLTALPEDAPIDQKVDEVLASTSISFGTSTLVSRLIVGGRAGVAVGRRLLSRIRDVGLGGVAAAGAKAYVITEIRDESLLDPENRWDVFASAFAGGTSASIGPLAPGQSGPYVAGMIQVILEYIWAQARLFSTQDSTVEYQPSRFSCHVTNAPAGSRSDSFSTRSGEESEIEVPPLVRSSSRIRTEAQPEGLP